MILWSINGSPKSCGDCQAGDGDAEMAVINGDPDHPTTVHIAFCRNQRVAFALAAMRYGNLRILHQNWTHASLLQGWIKIVRCHAYKAPLNLCKT